MRIPWSDLPAETLNTLLEEIVTRDGTDYGVAEKSTEQKVTHAKNQLLNGRAVLYWDPELESASLMNVDKAAQLEATLSIEAK
ncbi:MAG: YheU family protein [bacterium]